MKNVLLAMVLLVAVQTVPANAEGVLSNNPSGKRKISSFDELDAAGIGAGYKPQQFVDFDAVMRRDQELTPSPKPELGPIDQWRYDSCQQDAATAPTSQGVVIKMRVCRQKFGR